MWPSTSLLVEAATFVCTNTTFNQQQNHFFSSLAIEMNKFRSHLLTVTLREVNNTSAQRRQADQRPGTGMPELWVQASLLSSYNNSKHPKFYFYFFRVFSVETRKGCKTTEYLLDPARLDSRRSSSWIPKASTELGKRIGAHFLIPTEQPMLHLLYWIKSKHSHSTQNKGNNQNSHKL